MTARLRLASTLVALAVSGCVTLHEFPRPLGGVRRHLKALSGNSRYLFDQVAWWLLFPVSVTDLTLCLAADVVLLPVTAPGPVLRAWSRWRTERLREPPPPPPPPDPAQVAARERARAEAQRRRSAAARAEAELEAAVAAVAALAPDDAERRRVAALRERLWPSPDAPVLVLRDEDSFAWLPEGPIEPTCPAARLLDGLHQLAAQPGPSGHVAAGHVAERAGHVAGAVAACDRALDLDPTRGPAWTVRGWARLRAGDLERAEADLRLGELLSMLHENAAWARIGLGRVAEARGHPAAAARLYADVLAGGGVAEPPVFAGVDHASDLRARIAALEAKPR